MLNLALLAAQLCHALFDVWHFFRLHSPVEVDEYFEGGTTLLIFLLAGMLVWFLVIPAAEGN